MSSAVHLLFRITSNKVTTSFLAISISCQLFTWIGGERDFILNSQMQLNLPPRGAAGISVYGTGLFGKQRPGEGRRIWVGENNLPLGTLPWGVYLFRARPSNPRETQ